LISRTSPKDLPNHQKREKEKEKRPEVVEGIF
jgi:hypothetical protein